MPQQLTFTFNEAVAAASWSSAISVQNLSTGTTLSLSDSAFSFNSTNDTLTISLGTSRIPDGNYLASFDGLQIVDASGNQLAGSDGTLGDPYTSSFFILAGDANHDGIVNNADYLILQHNYAQSGQTWSGGDFNYDGIVNNADYLLLKKNYGENLAIGMPSTLQVTASSGTSASLSWTAATDPTVTGYDIIRNGQFLASVTGTSFTDTGLSASTAYTYAVESINNQNNFSPPTASVSVHPVAPSNLAGTAASASEIDLTWTLNSQDANSVQILRSVDDVNFSVIATLSGSATANNDTGLSECTEYWYEATAIGAGAATSPPALAVTLPATPSGLTATASGGDVLLSWTNNSSGADGIEILRSTDGVNFTNISGTDTGTSSYDDWAAPDGFTDYYEVRAIGLFTESAPSAVASAKPIAPLKLTDDTPATGVTYQVNHGQTLTVTNPTLLANDVDPNGLTLTIASHTNPAHGALSLNSDGTFTYVPNNNFVGTDAFTYTAADSLGASSNTANVSILVNDIMPQADDVRLAARQAADGNGNPLPYAASMSGTLPVSNPEGVPLTYSVVNGPGASQGTLTLNSTTGSYTLTPNSSYSGPITVVYKVNDGAIDSNLSTLSYTGYTMSGGSFAPIAQPWARGAGPSTWVYENGTMAISAQNGLLLNAVDNDPSPDPDSLSVDTNLVEGPKHGTLSINASDGSFVYQPNPGYTGPDWFTWRVKDGSKESGYTSWYVNVQPLPISLSFDNLAPGDPTAQIYPGPAGGNAPQSFSQLHINNMPGQLGDVLTISADDASAVNVFSGAPGVQGAVELFGHDQNTSSYTWTINPNSPPPATLYVVGVTPSDYDQVKFHLSYTLAEQGVDGQALAAPVSAPATQPVAATQPGTVPGKGGVLEVFDGTLDYEADNTIIYQLYKNHYNGKPFYNRGVGANARLQDKNITTGNLAAHFGMLAATGGNGFVAPGDDANTAVQKAVSALVDFYQDPKNRGVPLDIAGYSRGCFEATRLAGLIAGGIHDKNTKQTNATTKVVTFKDLPPIPTRFAAMLSPVITLLVPSTNGIDWPTSLPNSWQWMYQALTLKNPPKDDPLHQIAITRGPNTKGAPDNTYPDDHYGAHGIQNDPNIMNDLLKAAQQVNVPIK